MSRRSRDRARSRADVAPPSQPSFLYNSKQLSLIGCRTLAIFARVRFLHPLRRFSTSEHPFATSRKGGPPPERSHSAPRLTREEGEGIVLRQSYGCGLYFYADRFKRSVEPAGIMLKSEIPPKIPNSQFPRGNKHADTKANVALGCGLRGNPSRGAFPGSASPACGRVKCGSGR